MATFFAVVHRTSAGDFSVDFPDCPGCTAAGTTFAEAELRAAEALQLHLEALDRAGAELPGPSSIAEIKRDPASRGGVVIAVPVTARLKPTRQSRLTSRAAAASRKRRVVPPAA
jgi:predicted RNase H-like HicB family nuclease